MTRTFRAVGAMVAGWIWLVFAGLNLIDVAVRGRDLAALVAAAVLLFTCALAYTLLIRPRIVAGAAELRILNPLRTISVPWRTVRGIELTGATEAITVRCANAEFDAEFDVEFDVEFRAWALRSSPRSQRGRDRKRQAGSGPRAGRAVRGLSPEVAEAVENRTHTAFVVEQVNELAAVHSRGRRPASDGSAEHPSVNWAPSAVAALSLTGGLLAAVLTVAALR